MGGISFSKILENSHRRINDEAIVEFRKLVDKSICNWEGKIDHEWDNLSPDQFEDPRDMEDYRGVLDDQYYLVNQVKTLSYELSITALFKLVEIHTKRVVKWHMPSIDSSKLFNFNSLEKALPFDLKLVKNFQAFDELLELNNAIKHVGKVSEKLASKHSSKGWVKKENFTGLDKAFDRLSPLISEYMDDLAAKIYANSERDDT
ncbi:hypothetical protein J3L11_11565 [Shewanella sp. 4t3-1-2LB]|uniref:hypothetical protein n=1 Tax=Shewanella sp. 4t3-1-2LB TaxID=2817682 RepID=UPI001A9920BB|nr:hypothetical protein [Shewanella sp. 4t3-1-2LB]MBO1272282.1 hypothetical protein [Shewanella sp. 4t3-1-2LB]